MRTDNKKLIIELAELGVLEMKLVKNPHPSDITITYANADTHKIMTDKISDEELPILIQTKQLKMLKSIKNMLKFHTILTIIGLFGIIFWFLYFLGESSF